LVEKSEGAGVAANGAPVAEAVLAGELRGALPVQNALLDGLAVGMVADAAAGRVIAEIDGFPFVR
jgi:hypothetical protein